MKPKQLTKSSTAMTKADTDRLHARLDAVADNISDIKAISSANTTNIESLADTVSLLLQHEFEMAHKTPCPAMIALADRVTVVETERNMHKRDTKALVFSIVKYVICAGITYLTVKVTGG
jgi:hypothetical protein